MRGSLGIVAAVAGLFASPAAFAKDDAQVWTTASATVELGGNFRLSEDVIARFSDTRNGLYEVEIDTLLGYRLSKTVTLWAGYVHDPNYAGGDFTVLEHRGREQVSFDKFAKIGPGTLSARLRLEQRWREGFGGTGWRLRPYVKFVVPFRSGGKTALVLSHESFINLNTTDFQRVGGEERVRNLVAVTTPVAKNVNAEIGYLLQHGFVPNGDDSNDHVASVALSFAF